MKFEAGKYYLTRDGRKAYVLAIYPDDMQIQGNRRIAGVVKSFCDDEFYCINWTIEGAYNLQPKIQVDLDLVGPWVEPRKPITVTLWSVIRIDSGMVWDTYTSESAANTMIEELGSSYCIVKVTGTEEIK